MEGTGKEGNKISAYKSTTVNYMKTQVKIGEILTKNKIYDKMFFDKQSEKEIWLVFKYDIIIEDNKLPIGIKLVIPNIVEKNRDAKYRLLYWYLKSKFEAINESLFEDVNTTFIKEFYPHLIVNKGQTIYESLAPQLHKVITNKENSINLMLGFKEE